MIPILVPTNSPKRKMKHKSSLSPALMFLMASTKKTKRRQVSKEWVEQTSVAITVTFNGEQSGPAPGFSDMESLLKEHGHTSEPPLDKEETGRHR